ncbi:segregation/condensation protein A [Streptomyces marokkonensis]|uniref:segregation/condensation protein A n=1 Tax=Streptomyces marokkonensis TaxID=324855 RepID=UPI0011F237CC|nr:segregation/condensation protein A [Streptomyces marokkonensis]
MTSNDAPAPAPGDRPPRRRTLGRGPGAWPSAPAPDGPAAGRTPGEGTGAQTSPEPSPPETGAGGPGEPVPAAPAPARGMPGEAADAGLPAPVAPAATPEDGAAGPGEERDGGMSTGVPPAVDPVVTPGDAARAGGAVAALPDEAAAEHAVAPRAPEAAGEAVPDASAPGTGADDDSGRFRVRLANFEGPFDLLLQLIAKHKLDVTEVALSRVTDEFMAYIRALGPDWDLDETTEFLVVAATLLDLKAARLLPAAEVEDEADLALLEARDLLFARLLQYRAYKQIAEIFDRRLQDEARRYPRTVGLEPQHAELLPEVVIGIGAEGFARLAVKAMQPRPKPQVYVDHIHAPLVSVQEQAGIVVARLRELGEATFRALVEDTDDTLTVVARFLALLELYREKAVALDQETALGELTVRWTGGDGGAEPTVTDEFDRPPEQPQEERKP